MVIWRERQKSGRPNEHANGLPVEKRKCCRHQETRLKIIKNAVITYGDSRKKISKIEKIGNREERSVSSRKTLARTNVRYSCKFPQPDVFLFSCCLSPGFDYVGLRGMNTLQGGICSTKRKQTLKKKKHQKIVHALTN